jgi:hypothetical protein
MPLAHSHNQVIALKNHVFPFVNKVMAFQIILEIQRSILYDIKLVALIIKQFSVFCLKTPVPNL